MAAPLESQGIPVLIGDLRPGSVQAGFPSPAQDHMVKWIGFMPEFLKLKAANPTSPDLVPKKSQTLQCEAQAPDVLPQAKPNRQLHTALLKRALFY